MKKIRWFQSIEKKVIEILFGVKHTPGVLMREVKKVNKNTKYSNAPLTCLNSYFIYFVCEIYNLFASIIYIFKY